jgi:hypothetical protein
MPKFITIGYGDSDGYERTPEAVRNIAHAADAERVRQGDIMGIAGSPVQVRNTEGRGMEVTQGSFLSAPLPIAGFALVEAADLDAAIKIASQSPCAVAHGVVEVWPLDQPATD